MRLSAYIISVDCGFAPNPFGQHCTLACCKPTIRRKASVGDIIIGTASSRYEEQAGHLIYAMRVEKILSYQDYWDNPAYDFRKPSNETSVSRRGDNIWHQDALGQWEVATGAIHHFGHREHDIRGINVLIATDFFYFGRSAISIPAEFSGVVATTQGHKNTYDPALIFRFWDWLARSAPKLRRIGDPFDFSDEGCAAQCRQQENDDIEETETHAEPR
jgi:hypothetical protein